MSSSTDQKYVVKSIVSCKAAVIGPGNKVLLLRRSQSHPTKPGEWDLIGGLWDPRKTFDDTLRREAQEEANIQLFEIRLYDVLRFTSRKLSDVYYLSQLYMAKTDTSEVTLSYEHDAARWITLHELDNYQLRPHWRAAVEEAFKHFVG